jgi:hypothetical protein
MSSSIFRGITPFRTLNVNSCLEEHVPSTFRTEKYPKQDIFVCYMIQPDFLLGLFFDPEDEFDMFFPNIG